MCVSVCVCVWACMCVYPCVGVCGKTSVGMGKLVLHKGRVNYRPACVRTLPPRWTQRLRAESVFCPPSSLPQMWSNPFRARTARKSHHLQNHG